MASKRKKRKRRNRLIIAIATILILFLVAVMIWVAMFSLDSNSSEGTKFLIWEIPLLIAAVMIFFIAKDRIR